MPLNLILALVLGSLGANAIEKSEPKITALQYATDQLIDQGAVLTEADLRKLKAQVYVPPVDRHEPGAMIYRVKHGGKPFLIKILDFSVDGSSAAETLYQEMFGMLLGASVGGPQIRRVGHFEDASGHEKYFVEMEEIFPNADSFTFKAMRLNQNLDQRFSDKQLRQIAKLLRINIENGIRLGFDYDLIATRSQVRWLDTEDWTPFYGSWSTAEAFDWGEGDPVKIRYIFGNDIESALEESAHFLFELRLLHPKSARLIDQAVSSEIANSEQWTKGFKRRLTKALLDERDWFKDSAEGAVRCQLEIEGKL